MHRIRTRLTCLVGSIALLSALSGPALADEKTPSRTISVSGTGEVRVEPDEVILSFGAQTYDKDVKSAKAANDKDVQRILKYITDFGIKPDDTQTGELNIQPQYVHNDGRIIKIDGYTLHRGITVHLRDVKKFESLLQGLVESGVNQFDGIEFRTSELQKHRDTAREMALKAAREKATKMAAVLEQRIGRPLSIAERSNWYGGPQPWNMAANRMQQSSIAVGDGEGAGETFAPGRIMIKATVDVSFELQ